MFIFFQTILKEEDEPDANKDEEHRRQGRSTRYSRQEYDILHPDGMDSEVPDLHIYALGYNTGMKVLCITTRTCTIAIR